MSQVKLNMIELGLAPASCDWGHAQTCQPATRNRIIITFSHISTICRLDSALLTCYLLFLGQGEMSPGGDGHPAITGVAASAHDAQPVIVTHSAIAAVAELIDFI